MSQPVALSIAGSDSGAGAGIQADIKTFAALGVYGLTVVTAVTAQNTLGVRAMQEIDPAMVAAQLDAVAEDFTISALKTGMLANASIINVVAAGISRHKLGNLVLDPVMVAKGGDRLLREDALETLRSELIPAAAVVTPNLPEAEVITGRSIRSLADRVAAGRDILELGARAVVLKGGHADDDPVVDLLVTRAKVREFRARRIATSSTHGTGCTFSAAIAAGLAQGLSLEASVSRAREYVSIALEAAEPLGHGHGPLAHFTRKEAVDAVER